MKQMGMDPKQMESMFKQMGVDPSMMMQMMGLLLVLKNGEAFRALRKYEPHDDGHDESHDDSWIAMIGSRPCEDGRHGLHGWLWRLRRRLRLRWLWHHCP